MKNTKIVVNTRSKSYPIYFGDGILNTTGAFTGIPNAKLNICFAISACRLVLLNWFSNCNFVICNCSASSSSAKPSSYNACVSERLSVIPGQPPNLIFPSDGCPFADRCSYYPHFIRERSENYV